MVNPRIAATLTFITLFVAAAASAGTASTPVTVSAQVISRAILTVEQQPASVVVTEQDLARGYVDLAAPIQVHVRTNNRRGYVLQVNNIGEQFKSVELSAGSTTIHTSNESWLSRPYVAGGDSLALKVRLQLRKGAQAGLHMMPVVFAANAL